MSDNKQIVYTEGSPWFWKIFGGAVMGLISVLLLAHITNINNNIDRTFLDLRGDIKDIRQQLDTYKDRITAIEQNPFKDRIDALEKSVASIQTTLNGQTPKVAGFEASLIGFREEIRVMREWDKDQTKQLQEIRDRITTMTAITKDKK